MQSVYMRGNDHIEVFTTVLAPQVRYQYKAQAEKMVVTHSYRPNWPDELQLSQGDVVMVWAKHEEERWFGRLQNGQRGYFPASCVMELGQENVDAKDQRRTSSLKSSIWGSVLGLRGRGCESGHRLQAPGRGGRGGGAGPKGAQGEKRGPILVLRTQIPLPLPSASQSGTQRSPGLFHRILSKRWRKTEYRGATNGAFEAD